MSSVFSHEGRTLPASGLFSQERPIDAAAANAASRDTLPQLASFGVLHRCSSARNCILMLQFGTYLRWCHMHKPTEAVTTIMIHGKAAQEQTTIQDSPLLFEGQHVVMPGSVDQRQASPPKGMMCRGREMMRGPTCAGHRRCDGTLSIVGTAFNDFLCQRAGPGRLIV